MYILGIDGGGTKTTGILVDPCGNVLSLITVEATNPQSIEINLLEKRMAKLIEIIQSKTGEHFNQIGMVFAGVSGADRPKEKQLLFSTLRKLVPQNAAIEVDNDGINALYSGTHGRAGIVNIAGTGALSFGVNEKGERARVGGWGYLLGDPGSGYAIGLSALQSVFQSYDQCRHDSTILTKMILNDLKLDAVPQLVEKIYEAGKSRFFIASLCPIVISAADQGDPVAKSILLKAAMDMSASIFCLVNKIFPDEARDKKRIPVVLAGGVYSRSEWFLPVMEDEFSKMQVAVEWIPLRVPPVVGTVYAARKRKNIQIEGKYVTTVEQSIVQYSNRGNRI